MTAAIAAAAVGAAAAIGGSVISAQASSAASKRAARAQRDAAALASETELEQYYTTRQDLATYRALGDFQALELHGMAQQPQTYERYQPGAAYDPNANPYTQTPVYTGPTDQELRADPGYQFRLAEGQRALERSAAARGLQLSGGQLRDLTRYGQELGAQEYGNVYARGYQRNADLEARNLQANQLAYARGYQLNADQYTRASDQYRTNFDVQQSLRQQQFNERATIAQAGLNAAGRTAALGAQTAANIGANQRAVGNAQAAGIIGASNATNAGIGNAIRAAGQGASDILLSIGRNNSGYASGVSTADEAAAAVQAMRDAGFYDIY